MVGGGRQESAAALDRAAFLSSTHQRLQKRVRSYGLSGTTEAEVLAMVHANVALAWDSGYRAGCRTQQTELPF